MKNPIEEWMAKTGKSLEYIADRCGVSRATMYRFMNNGSHHVRVRTVVFIHRLTKIPYDYLMKYIERDMSKIGILGKRKK